MEELVQGFYQGIAATSFWEWLAVLCAIAYLLLAVNEKISCWYAGFASTAIYSVLFFDVNLYMESLLNLYYLIMAIYGWYQWKFQLSGKAVKAIKSWSLTTHAMVVLVVFAISLVNGYLLSSYTNASFAYLDSLTTWFAVVTTYMVAQKILENWIYWIAINSVSIYIYTEKGFVLTAVLLVSYLIISSFGWVKWKKRFNHEQTNREVPAT